eukprot:m.91577 g.91577  ORF g.91577 m.91577 type:complete len:69 (-) comp12329_c1_seq3:128-334(-)
MWSMVLGILLFMQILKTPFSFSSFTRMIECNTMGCTVCEVLVVSNHSFKTCTFSSFLSVFVHMVHVLC